MWSTFPSAGNLHSFSEKLVSLDMLHVLHLGVLRDLVGTAFKLLCRSRGEFYNGRTIAKRLSQLTSELKKWVKAQGLQLSLRRIHRKTLLWRSDCCPEIRCKGADAAVCLRFLASKLQEQAPRSYPGLVVCVWACERFIACLAGSSIFLEEQERATAHTTGQLFLRSYLGLAVQSLEANELLFKTRPKIHFLTHIIDDLAPDPAGCRQRNPYFDATFVDEDWVKHVIAMKRKMSFRTSSLNVLKRFCTVNKVAYDSLTSPAKTSEGPIGSCGSCCSCCCCWV